MLAQVGNRWRPGVNQVGISMNKKYIVRSLVIFARLAHSMPLRELLTSNFQSWPLFLSLSKFFQKRQQVLRLAIVSFLIPFAERLNSTLFAEAMDKTRQQKFLGSLAQILPNFYSLHRFFRVGRRCQSQVSGVIEGSCLFV